MRIDWFMVASVFVSSLMGAAIAVSIAVKAIDKQTRESHLSALERVALSRTGLVALGMCIALLIYTVIAFVH